MRYLTVVLIFCINLFGYNFVLLNNTGVEDDAVIEYIEAQFTNHYYSSDSDKNIKFAELTNKEELMKIILDYDYSSDREEQQKLIDKYEDLEDDLNAIFNAEYFLIAKETKDREGRDELQVVLKYKGSNYLDETYIMPRLEDDKRDDLYIKTLANIVLLYIGQNDTDFSSRFQY